MKLHNISKVLGVGIAALLLTACKDGNDWSVDSSKARVFSVSSTDISIDREMTQATVTFKPTKGVENYTLEVSPSELNDNVVEGAAAGTKVINISSKEVNKEGKIEYTITGLKKDTRYWLRVRSNASGKTASKWTYYEDSSKHRYFKTKAEQIFSTYTYFATKTISPKQLKENEVILKWKADEGSETAAVTHLVLTVGKNEPTTITLDATDIAARSKTLKYADYGIGANTEFNVIIYNNDDKRGEFTLTSPKERPAGLHVLDETTETIEGLIAAATGNIAIGIPATPEKDSEGNTITDPIDAAISVSTITIPEGVSVTLYGLPGGLPRCIKLTKNMEVGGNHGWIRFENLQINDDGAKYIFNQKTECNIDEVSFTNVSLYKFANSVVRLSSDSPNKRIKKLTMDYCLVENQKGGAFIYNNNAATSFFNEITITNSTFNGLEHSFINVAKSEASKIVISNVTFYNIIGNDRYFIDANEVETTIECNRCIFAKTNNKNAKGIRTKFTELEDEASRTNYSFGTSYMTSDFTFKIGENNDVRTGRPFSAGTTVPSSSKIFKEPKEGNFMLTEASIEGGDPRWIEPTDD